MKRGDLVTIAVQGDFGKPRPALVMQADFYAEHSSVTVLPVTSHVVDAPLLRVDVSPGPVNGLRASSQVMVDKAVTVRRVKLGATIGEVDASVLLEVERRLAVFLGIG